MSRLTAAERREQILEAAAGVFGARGFEATRMHDVAAAAGVATGLLYKHFPSKDELFTALVERQATDVAERIAAALAQTTADPVGDALAVWFASLAAAEFQVADPGEHAAYRAIRARFRGMVAGALAETFPDLRRDVVRVLAAAVEGAAEAAGEEWREKRGSLSQRAAVDLTAKFIAGGLANAAT